MSKKFSLEGRTCATCTHTCNISWTAKGLAYRCSLSGKRVSASMTACQYYKGGAEWEHLTKPAAAPNTPPSGS